MADVYPDSVDSDDPIKCTGNRQGEVVTKNDQTETVHNRARRADWRKAFADGVYGNVFQEGGVPFSV